MGIIDALVECEVTRFLANMYRGLTDAPAFEIVGGQLPVLVSAPHAVTHIRDGNIKPSEDFTGAIALAAAKRSGCHCLVATRTDDSDPNWDPLESCAYKQMLCEYIRDNGIKCVLDVHGMVAASESLVEIGSADGLTCTNMPGFDEDAAAELRELLRPWIERFDKPVTLNGRFGARGKNTVTHTVATECGITALQIEVATQLRVPVRLKGRVPRGEKIPFSKKQLPVEIEVRRRADPKAVLALINALVRVVHNAAARQ